MSDLILFNELDHLQWIRFVHDDIRGPDIKVGHEETVQLCAMEQGKSVKAYIVGVVLTVKDAAVILGLRERGARASLL